VIITGWAWRIQVKLGFDFLMYMLIIALFIAKIVVIKIKFQMKSLGMKLIVVNIGDCIPKL